jgi:hypothetical protein
MRKTSLLLAASLAFPGAALATPTVSGDGACGIRAVDNESFVTCEGERAPAPAPEAADDALPTAFPINARQAVQIIADLGSRALLADIREHAPGSRLLDQLDDALVAQGLRHGDPVIVLVRSRQHGRLAADLMGEHGYHQVFVVSERDEESLAARQVLP